jgi:DNA-binding NtrC family response regulator
LYFRLNVLSLAVLPLRERRADILPLADALLATLRTIHAKPNVQLSEPARRVLLVYGWPGNVRELRNALERAVVFARTDTLDPENLPKTVQSAASAAPDALAGMLPVVAIERRRQDVEHRPPSVHGAPKFSESAAKRFSKNAKIRSEMAVARAS